MGISTSEQIEKEIEKLQAAHDAKLEQLNLKKKEALKRENEADQGGRAIAAGKIGDYVVSLFKGDWRTIDPEALVKGLKMLDVKSCTKEPDDIATATRIWKRLKLRSLAKAKPVQTAEQGASEE